MSEIEKYIVKQRKNLPPIYNIPIYKDERAIILSEIHPKMRVLDYDCEGGMLYTNVLLPNGFDGEYVGISKDAPLGDFPVFKSVDDVIEKYPARYFDVLIMVDTIEKMPFETFIEHMTKLNKLIDGKLIIITPNPKCLDNIFADPRQVTFYNYPWLYGLAKYFGFENIKLFRGGGVAVDRLIKAKMLNKNVQEVMDMNAYQRKTCVALDLDWCADLLMVAERSE